MRKLVNCSLVYYILDTPTVYEHQPHSYLDGHYTIYEHKNTTFSKGCQGPLSLRAGMHVGRAIPLFYRVRMFSLATMLYITLKVPQHLSRDMAAL